MSRKRHKIKPSLFISTEILPAACVVSVNNNISFFFAMAPISFIGITVQFIIDIHNRNKNSSWLIAASNSARSINPLFYFQISYFSAFFFYMSTGIQNSFMFDITADDMAYLT